MSGLTLNSIPDATSRKAVVSIVVVSVDIVVVVVQIWCCVRSGCRVHQIHGRDARALGDAA